MRKEDFLKLMLQAQADKKIKKNRDAIKNISKRELDEERRKRNKSRADRMLVSKVCKAEECVKNSNYSGYCPMHQMRIKRHGDQNKTNRTGPKEKNLKCTHQGCDLQHKSRGYCSKHYAYFIQNQKNKI